MQRLLENETGFFQIAVCRLMVVARDAHIHPAVLRRICLQHPRGAVAVDLLVVVCPDIAGQVDRDMAVFAMAGVRVLHLFGGQVRFDPIRPAVPAEDDREGWVARGG